MPWSPKSTLHPNLPLDNGQGWHPLDHKPMSPEMLSVSQRQSPNRSPWFFGLMNADSADLLSAAPAEVGKQGFLQIIYRTHHYLCSTYLATVIIQTAFQHRKLMTVAL